MIESNTQDKERMLSIRRGQTLYKAADSKSAERLKTLINASIEECAKYATSEKVSLNDIEAVRERSILYIRACEETGVYPSSTGLARALGYTRRSLAYWREQHPESDTGQWLEMMSDTFADVLNQSALNNCCNAIVSIFLSKALYGYKETSELMITPHERLAYDRDREYNQEEILARYTFEDNDGRKEE